MVKRNFSTKRNAIYNAICSTDTHPSANWIYEKLKPDFPDLSLGTVYRNISLFKNEDKVRVICNINGEERIDGNVTSHPHFVCKCCGAVYDIDDKTVLNKDVDNLTNDGFIVENKEIIYYGRCPKCSK